MKSRITNFFIIIKLKSYTKSHKYYINFLFFYIISVIRKISLNKKLNY